jgi:TolB-like protein/Flp pilus assembly protein TadD
MNQADAAPADRSPATLRIAEREIDLERGLLRDARGSAVEMRPQVWAVLRHLALHANRVVTKEELLDAVWPGLVVTDGSVAQAISDVRSALGEGRDAIKTLPRRGYMLVAEPVAEPAAAEPVTQRPSIAVLPFNDPTGEAVGRQLARGLAQDLVAELARNVGLRVVSHHSSFAFADGTTPLAEIGRRLRSRHLVDGSVRRDGEALHVVVELIDSETGDVVWSSRYTASSSDAVAHRNALVERIAGTVMSRVIHRRDRSALARPPKTLDVYAMTLRGIALRREGQDQAYRDGRALLEQAIALDPDYAPAWSALGYLNTMDIIFRFTRERGFRYLPEAVAQVERAIALGFEEAEAYIALSLVRAAQRRFHEALDAAKQAIGVGPSDVHAWHNMANALYCLGRCGEALASVERAMDLNPMPSIWTLAQLAAALWGNGRHEEAIRVAGEVLVRHPGLWRCQAHRMYALFESGRVTEAREDAARLLARLPQLTADLLAWSLADEAVELRARSLAAARGSGIP